jgi:hypothetical protein
MSASLPLLALALLPQDQDPTVPDARLREALSAPQAGAMASSAPAAASALPGLVLRGLVIARGRPGAALVEADGALLRAEADAVLHVPLASGGFHAVRVVALTHDEVRLESLATGAVVVLR